MSIALVCTRCGSNEVSPRVRVVEYGEGNARYDLQVEVYRRPNAMLFKGAELSKVFAQLCGACGHIELYADTPHTLYAAYEQADPRTSPSAAEELERTREALADAQLQLRELEEKLAFLEQLFDRKALPPSPPKGDQ